jgi:tRNA pseudouridine13 synthase
MANRYDDLERKVGIAEYASPHDGFAAVVKARYSDFVVHEVDLNGNVARLDKLETSAQEEEGSTPMQVQAKEASNVDDANSRKRKLSENAVDDAPGSKKESDVAVAGKIEVDWNSFTESLCKFVGDDTGKEVISFLQQDDPAEQFYTLPTIADKQARRNIHQLFKRPEFNSVVRANNHEGRLRVWHKSFFDKMPKDTFVSGSNNQGKARSNKPKKSDSWPRDRPNFLRFVLYKENIDTSTAAKDVTRFARLNPKRGINYAGMKDKRGVTTQFCSAFRVEKEQLLAINKRDGVGGGNSSTNGSCIIRVGNLTYSNEEVKLGALSGNRFDIVLRNIDTGGDDDHDTIRRKLELAGEAFKQHGFINYFGMQRFGKSVDTHEVGLQILKGDFEGAIDIIMREKADGDSPRVLEARRTWAKRFDGISVKEEEDKARETEGKIARQVERMCSRFMVCEKSIVSSLSRKPRDYKRAFASISKNMRSMFLHAYQSFLWNKVASFRIKTGGSTLVREGDLVLIEDKSLGEKGGGTSGLKGKRVKVVDELDIKEGKFTIEDVVLPLVGSRVDYPTGSSGDFLVELMEEDGISKDAFNQIGDKEISLCGDYRKLMCKPSDVTFAVKEYYDPLQPLISTDLMELSGTTTETVEAKKDEEVLFGMVIGFTLPPSAYATIALRELTKRPTSSEYQSKLELSSGKCERNLVCS